METKHLKDAEIFWDNGKYVAIITDHRGTRRNVAPYSCLTKAQAKNAVREYLGMPIREVK